MFSFANSWFGSTICRITLTRTATFFFLVTLLHCLVQSATQGLLLSLDNTQRSFLESVVARGDIPAQNTTFVEANGAGGLILRICSDIPYEETGKVYPCTTVFTSGRDATGDQITRSLSWKQRRDVLISKAGGSAGAVVLQPASASSIFLTQQCVQTLVHPLQRITNHRREDIAHIALQFWLLAISLFGLVNDSVPHILSATITRTLSTAWSTYAVWRCLKDVRIAKLLLSNPGTPCALDVFSDYHTKRFRAQLADMVCSVVALALALYLSFALIRRYSAQAFKCVGAPAHVHRVNKFFLALLATLQLEVFILTCGMSMWIDVLRNTAIARISSHTPEYIGVFVASAVLLIPWIMTGWYSIKKERPFYTLAFLILGLIFIFGWSMMFYSKVYRWTFTQWPFLGCFTVASLTLLTASMVLGIVCRLNFGRGHAEYLRAEANLSSLNFPQASFSRDEKREALDPIEKGQIYCIQTRETLVEDGFRSPSKSPLDWDFDGDGGAPFKLKPLELGSGRIREGIRGSWQGVQVGGERGTYKLKSLELGASLRSESPGSAESHGGWNGVDGLPRLSKLAPVVYP